MTQIQHAQPELPYKKPILIAAGLLEERTPIPWRDGRILRFEIP